MKLYTKSLLDINKDYQYWQLWKLAIPSPFPPSQTSIHLEKKQMTSSYPLDWPLARFSKNFISKISFTPSEWTASVKSSSVVHWKIFLIFKYESLSKTPRKGQLSLVWTWSRGILYPGCQSLLTFGEQSFIFYNSQKINLKNIQASSFVTLHQPLHTVYQLQFTKEKKYCISVTLVFWEHKPSKELFQ